MDGPAFARGARGRGGIGGRGGRGWPHSRNKHWSTTDGNSRNSTPTSGHSDGERWERGGHRGGVRGRGLPRGSPRKFPNVSLRVNNPPVQQQPTFVDTTQTQSEDDYDEYQEEEAHIDEQQQQYYEESEEEHAVDGEVYSIQEIHEPEFETAEEREKFYQELVKAREVERKKAIAEGKMDDPLVPKRLEDAISIVGTCMDMCPRFERYRRERENNLFEWETIPGTKRVDHNRAVKMYERAAGDKTLPSDLRPPQVLKLTLDYLFHDLLPRGGFSATFNFIRDRTRSVRNDFTMQHITGSLAIECHDRCARFHILALHFERDRTGFSIPLEEQQLMNTLQSLKEFYEDQRGRYESPTELEMRVYHRLIHIRDQKERHEDIPEYITSHPVFKLTTDFRLHVQHKSAPISKTSKLIVTEEGMQIFSQLATVLNEQGSRVMVYLVACLLERLFGKDTIDNIEGIRGDLSVSDIIDGVFSTVQEEQGEELQGEEEYVDGEGGDTDEFLYDEDDYDGTEDTMDPQHVESQFAPAPAAPAPLKPSATEWLSSNFSDQSSPPLSVPTASAFNLPPVANSAFGNLVSTPNVFGATSIFGNSAFTSTKPGPVSVFGNIGSTPQSAFGNLSSTSSAPITSTLTPPQAAVPPSQTSSNVNGLSTKPPTSAPPPTEPPSLFGNPFASPSQHISSHSAPPAFIFGGSNGSSFSAGFPSNPPASSSSFFSASPSNPPPSLNPKASEFKPTQPSQPSIFSRPLSDPSNDNIKISSGSLPSIPTFTHTPPPTTTNRPPPNGTTGISGPYTAGSPTPPPSYFNKPSPPTSASSTPPPSRLIAPPLLKIDTNTSSGSSTPSVASPRVPPPLAKQQPISLPSTPTMILQPPNPLLGHLRNTLGPSSSSPSGSQEILSPLVMGSPTTSSIKTFNNFTPLSTPQASRIFKVPSPTRSNGKGKAPDLPTYDIEGVEQMKMKALKFAQKSSIVKQLFRRWLKKTTNRAAYLEARKHGDEYREKLKQSNRQRPPLQTSKNPEPIDKKRRISSNGGLLGSGDSLSPQKKRARKRISTEYRPPRTDEDLAKRFKENHREHEIRWAQGSFLQVIRKHVKRLNSSTLKMPWHIWLTMNPESDATAIWLERKFEVPESGSWANESVFSIPLSSASGTMGYPGVIVFECTPLGDVVDDLERKYRILDDCSRLREIIKALPEKRHFIPSLLVICWTDGGQTDSESDFFDMAKKLVADSVLQSYQVFAMTTATKDLDNKLDTVLSSLTLDTEGKLVQSLSLREAFKVLEPTFNLFLSEWMENCSTYGRFNWSLYGQVVQVALTLLNVMANSVRTLLELEGLGDPLPDFNGSQLDDSDSAYDDSMEWLSNLDSRDDARMIAMDIQSHRNIGQDFPARIFIEHIFELTQTRLERTYPKAANNHRPVLFSAIKFTLQAFKDVLQAHQMKLLQLYNFSVRRSPKRRTYSVGTSEQGSPEAKRPRLSASVASSINEDYDVPSTPRMNGQIETQTPSPTSSVVSLVPTERDDQAPPVTVAMLRALTRDLKKKYGGS